jgi:hypothetical protein
VVIRFAFGKYLLAPLIVFSSSLGHCQGDEYEYLDQSYDIFEITVANILIDLMDTWDTIQVMDDDDKTIYTVDPSWTKMKYPESFGNSKSLNGKIHTIETNLLLVKFKYYLNGKVRKVKFIYSGDIPVLAEGTVRYYKFEFENDSLAFIREIGFYGERDYHFSYK